MKQLGRHTTKCLCYLLKIKGATGHLLVVTCVSLPGQEVLHARADVSALQNRLESKYCLLHDAPCKESNRIDFMQKPAPRRTLRDVLWPNPVQDLLRLFNLLHPFTGSWFFEQLNNPATRLASLRCCLSHVPDGEPLPPINTPQLLT